MRRVRFSPVCGIEDQHAGGGRARASASLSSSMRLIGSRATTSWLRMRSLSSSRSSSLEPGHHALRRVVRDVGVLLVAQPLDHVDVHRERDAAARAWRRRRSAASSNASGRMPTMTWSRSPTAARMSSGRSNVTNGSVSLPPSTRAGDEVHRRRADEAGDEHVHRVARRAHGAWPPAGARPLRSTATRSPSVIASVWSCVT